MFFKRSNAGQIKNLGSEKNILIVKRRYLIVLRSIYEEIFSNKAF